MRSVAIRMAQPAKFEWYCPDCKKMNFYYRYSYSYGWRDIRVRCDYCGKIFKIKK